jgi:hypothetical protein
MVCEREIENFRKAVDNLWKVGINPKHLGKDFRDIAIMGRLTNEVLEAVRSYRESRRRIYACSMVTERG